MSSYHFDFVTKSEQNSFSCGCSVFPINATTGVLGAAVSGSPFDLGLFDGITLAVHPNGRFVYAADGLDGSVHAWSVNETTGVPTQIAAEVFNESGSFYEACCTPTHVVTITPNGSFLYSANSDATVGAPIKSIPMAHSRTSRISTSGRVTPERCGIGMESPSQIVRVL